MTETEPRYCVDTSAWLDGWRRYYPIETFPSLWLRIEELIQDGRLFWAEEVGHEIHDDDLMAWLNPLTQGVIATASTWNDAGAILEHFNPGMHQNGISGADAYVVATAQLHSLSVVTGEKAGGQRRPKIPDVCAQLNLGCMDLLALLRQERWTF